MSFKKVIAISSVSIAAAGIFAGCSGGDAKDVAGKYYIVSMEVEGNKINIKELAALSGQDTEKLYIELKEDGTGTYSFEDDVTEITWTKDEIKMGDESLKYTVKGKELVISQDGGSIKAEKK